MWTPTVLYNLLSSDSNQTFHLSWRSKKYFLITRWLQVRYQNKISNKHTSKGLYTIVFNEFLKYYAQLCIQYECVYIPYHPYFNHRVRHWLYLLQFKLFFCKFDTPPSIRHVIRAFKFDKVVPPFALNYIWIGWHIYSLFTQ